MIKRTIVHTVSCDGWNLEKLDCDTEVQIESDDLKYTADALERLGWGVPQINKVGIVASDHLLCPDCIEHLTNDPRY